MQLHSLTNPKDARCWIEQNLVDILVPDLEMPGVNGLELLRPPQSGRILAQVLFVTGHSTLEALTDALELGAHGLLVEAAGSSRGDRALWRTLISDCGDGARPWQARLRQGMKRNWHTVHDGPAGYDEYSSDNHRSRKAGDRRSIAGAARKPPVCRFSASRKTPRTDRRSLPFRSSPIRVWPCRCCDL